MRLPALRLHLERVQLALKRSKGRGVGRPRLLALTRVKLLPALLQLLLAVAQLLYLGKGGRRVRVSCGLYQRVLMAALLQLLRSSCDLGALRDGENILELGPKLQAFQHTPCSHL